MLPRSWIIFAALALGRVAFGYQFQTTASLTTDLIGRYGPSYAQVGDLIGVYNLLGVFVALPLGLLGRRFGDHLVMGSGLLLMTAGAGLSAWADGPAMIALGRAVAARAS
jgi:predicted MFS family arabinose efflux permease